MPVSSTVAHMNTEVCEGGALKITIEIYDSNGDLVVPSSLKYSVFDEYENVVNDQEDVELSLEGSQSVWLSGADLEPGLNYFVLVGTYQETDAGELPLRAFASFRVINVPGI